MCNWTNLELMMLTFIDEEKIKNKTPTDWPSTSYQLVSDLLDLFFFFLPPFLRGESEDLKAML